MGTKVRRILFEGHILFSVPDMGAYLGIGDFRKKMEKVGLAPIQLPLPDELMQPGSKRNHAWMGWDDLHKIDKRYKWSGSTISKKLSIIRMWDRNKDADAYYLTHKGEMKLDAKRPRELKDLGEQAEIILDQIERDLTAVGFAAFKYWIRPTGPGDTHPHWIFFTAVKKGQA